MEKQGESRGWWLLLGCLVWAAVMLIGSDAGWCESPGVKSVLTEGKVVFEDKQAGVKIIKTPAGVILQIITDNQGRQTVKELESYPPLSGKKRN